MFDGDIQAITSQVEQLSSAADFWNNLMLWGLAVAALAAVFIVVTTRLALTRTSQAATAQGRLDAAKDREKDLQIAALAETAEKERLARVQLEKEISPRRLTGEQITALSSLLKRDSGSNITIISAMLDGESSDFANDIDAAFKDAGWNTQRWPTRATEERGVEIGVVGDSNIPPPAMKIISPIRDAIVSVGVPCKITAFHSDDRSANAKGFEKNALYLVVNHKPVAQISSK